MASCKSESSASHAKAANENIYIAQLERIHETLSFLLYYYFSSQYFTAKPIVCAFIFCIRSLQTLLEQPCCFLKPNEHNQR
mmetsp:Transcript_31727/g.45691  ORF Transcript_31727/g.45691 Transcript_31727/m.45691 type:complete len:81 (-) Transcript_31727:862-1104(-)